MKLPGQGTRLPSSTGLDGEWICEGQFFFEVTDGALTSERPIVTHTLVMPDESRAVGFDVEVVAMNLGMSGNDLLNMNRRVDVAFKIVAGLRPGYPATVFLRTPSSVCPIELDSIAIRGH